MQDDQDPTPLQVKLEGMAEDIGTMGLIAALLTIAVLWVHLLINIIQEEVPNLLIQLTNLGKVELFSYDCLNYVMDSFLLGVTILVAAIPEGLALAVTVALAYSIGKMKAENNFVKNLAGITNPFP